LKTELKQSYPAVSLSSLKLFEVAISTAGLYAVARTVYLCGAKLATHCLDMRDDYYGFIVIFRDNDSV
jgi:hypothetical protein